MKINEAKSRFLENFNKIDKLIAGVIDEERKRPKHQHQKYKWGYEYLPYAYQYISKIIKNTYPTG